MTNRICPLFFSSGADLEEFECRPDRCAWAYGGKCAMLTLARCLDDMVENGVAVWPEPEADDDTDD